MWDYVSVSGSKENRMTEYVTHLQEHYKHPATAKNSNYMPPLHPGYGCELKEESMATYEFPNGKYWSNKK